MELGNVIKVNPEQARKDYPYDEIEYIDISSVGTGILHEVKQIEFANAPSRAKRIISNGDTLLATVRPNLRAFWFAKNIKENTIASTGFAVLRANEGSEPRFIYYLVTDQHFTDYLTANAKGAAYPAVDKEIIERADIYLPPIPTQRKIAAILSAYDDLIENNLRRIKILEEMAQNLYREWFVNFRFPGHEQTRFVDSPLGRIPEGWEIVPMKSVANVVDCLHSKKPDAHDEGSGILVQLFNIQDGGKLDFSKKYMISKDDYVKWTKRIELSEGDCIITNVGRIAAVAQMPKGKKAALGRNMTGLRPIEGKIKPTYLIEYLLSPHMTNEVRKKSDAGVIMDSLNVRSIYLLSVPIPKGTLMDDFECIARPIRQSIESLVEKNHVLRQTRDLLLPKLISGEVDVSDLDITLPEEALA